MLPNSGRLWVHPGCPGGAPEVPQMYPKGALLTLTSARTYPFEVSQSPVEGTLRSPNSVLPLEILVKPNFGEAKFWWGQILVLPNSGRLWVHPGCPGGAPEVPQMYPKGALLTLTSARTYPFEVSQSPLEGTLRSPNFVLPLETLEFFNCCH